MFDTTKLDELVTKLIDALPASVKDIKADLEKNFKAILQSAFAKLDLVTREEFDAQKGVLLRTREKLEALEKNIKKLEEKNNGTGNHQQSS